MFDTPKPEVVIGIDVGMTCTGVAYSMGPEWPPPRAVQHWPGIIGSALASKVPTAVAYDPHTDYDIAWGFCCEDQQEGHVEELFKLYLDADYCDSNPNAPTHQQAERWFTDYMRHLHKYLQTFFSRSFPRWNTRNVEFLFSVPTTWKNPAMIAHLERLIHNAGFGERDSHSMRISLTEAEAAGVWVAKQNYEKDDVYLICDAGGGTTDVNILKIVSDRTVELAQLSSVEGAVIGSSMINFKMQKLVEARLKPIQHLIYGEIDVIAEQMLRGRFDTFKCSFGSAASNLDKLPLAVPGLAPGQTFPQSAIEDGKMIITREELQHVFDALVEKVFKLVDTQLEKLQITHSMENISYLVLSGGFGSSPYVQQRLKERYERGGGKHFPNARNVQVLLAPEPQLAVCNGLVANRTQEIATDHVIYRTRCCRVSYGIVCRLQYDPIKHLGEEVSRDPRDGKCWVEHQIDWVVKQGQEILVETGVTRHYRLKLELGKESEPWRGQIVMSTLPPKQLPRSLKHKGATEVCRLEALLQREDMKRKNNHWYNLSREYWLANFDVRILIGPADLRFQLVGAGGEIRSNGADSRVAVEWESPQRGSASYS